MEQNTQSSENNNQAEDSIGSGKIFNEPRKKSSKKIVLVGGVVMIILGVVASYLLFFSNKEDDNIPVVEDEKNEEVEIDKELDSDQDGLPDYIEKVLGTDVNNSDTDGDSYSDFEEIKNGYNPLGDEKFTEEEWEGVKGKIRSGDEGLFGEMFENNNEIIQRAISVCQKIESDDQKELCFALTKNNSLECEGLSSILKEGCYLMYALLDNDISLCEKSLDSGFCSANILKDDSKCEFSDDKDTCFSFVALSKEDSSICLKVENEIMQNICLATINEDIKYCKNIEDKDFFEDMCLFSLAMVKNDVSICSEMKLEQQNNCISFVNKDLNKINCEDLSVVNYCTILGTEMMDDSFCDLIKTENSSDSFLHKNFRDQCRLTVASQILSTLRKN